MSQAPIGWVLAIGLAAVLAPDQQVFGRDHQSSPLAKGAPRRQIQHPIQDFSLADQEGKPFRFQSSRGKVVLVSFIYTTCPDVCPLITASMRLVQEGLKPSERQSVQFLSITTDPEVDTPQVLKSYAERYKVDFSNWSFVTGDLKSLEAVWKAFGVKVQRKARGLVNHTALTALIDKKGVMRFAYDGAAPDHKMILQDTRRLLASNAKY